MDNKVVNQDKSYVSDFILAVINDVTETIRFIDTKIGVIFLLYGFVITGLLEAKNNIYRTIKFLSTKGVCYGTLFICILSLFLIFGVLSMLFSMFTILPRINPSKSIVKGDFDDDEMWYIFSTSNDHKTLKTTLDNYSSNILEKSVEDIVKFQSFELLKLSYIRNKKLDSFNKSFIFFLISLMIIIIVAIVTVIVNVL